MTDIKNLDVQISMEKTIEAILNTLSSIGTKKTPETMELISTINTKIKEAEEYYCRPIDSPKVYTMLKDFAVAHGDNNTAKECEKKIKRIEAYDLEFKGRLQSFYGNNTEALKFLSKAAELDPEFKEAKDEKEKAINAISKAETEISRIENSLKSKPNDAKLLYKKGLALLNLGKAQDAMISLDKAMAIDPNNVDIIARKGTALESVGKYEESIGFFDKALKLKPSSMTAKRGKTYAEYNLKKF